MPAIHPTADQMRALRDDPREGPIAQVNLLKFKPKATYPERHELHDAGLTGAEAYRKYGDGFAGAAAELGAVCLLSGQVERYFIGQGDWDAVLVMFFPTRAKFIEMLNHPLYAQMHVHRDAGLLCQELLSTEPMVVSGAAV